MTVSSASTNIPSGSYEHAPSDPSAVEGEQSLTSSAAQPVQEEEAGRRSQTPARPAPSLRKKRVRNMRTLHWIAISHVSSQPRTPTMIMRKAVGRLIGPSNRKLHIVSRGIKRHTVKNATFENNQKVDDLVTMLDKLFSTRDKYKRLLSCRNANAQEILDIFQRLLDLNHQPNCRFRRSLIAATQRLAMRSGLYPACFELKDITAILEPCVSNGAFADIYKGVFRDRSVCLKTIRLDQRTDIRHLSKVLSQEAILWGQLWHPNVLPFYGIYHFQNRLSLVSPWMEHGDITTYLRKYPSANRLLLACDVAQGLLYLHDNGIIHGDLKGPNILVNELERACIADFGLSSISDPEILAWTSQSPAASKGGSVRWQAPELFDPDSDEDVHNTVFSDVYAWACIAYEIFIGKIPFFHLSRNAAVLFKVKNGERPTRPPNASPSWTAWGLTEDIWKLMQDCWITNPINRPTVEQIIKRLGDEKHGTNDAEDIFAKSDQSDHVLSPLRFREMSRLQVGLEELSVEAFELLLNYK